MRRGRWPQVLAGCGSALCLIGAAVLFFPPWAGAAESLPYAYGFESGAGNWVSDGGNTNATCAAVGITGSISPYDGSKQLDVSSSVINAQCGDTFTVTAGAQATFTVHAAEPSGVTAWGFPPGCDFGDNYCVVAGNGSVLARGTWSLSTTYATESVSFTEASGQTSVTVYLGAGSGSGFLFDDFSMDEGATSPTTTTTTSSTSTTTSSSTTTTTTSTTTTTTTVPTKSSGSDLATLSMGDVALVLMLLGLTLGAVFIRSVLGR